MIGSAKPASVFNQCVENRLKIERRAAYDLQNFARRGLLFQSLSEVVVPRLQFLEQPDIFNGDHSLVGEGFEQSYLLI